MKNKIFIFSVGLVAGLTIGVLFSVAIKELLVEFRQLHISLNKINAKQSQLSQRLDSIQGKLVPDTKKVSNTNSQTNTRAAVQTPAKNSSSQQDLKPATKTMAETGNTSVKNDSDVVVMTNQLISVLIVRLRNKDTNAISKTSQTTDSAIASMSEVGQAKQASSYRIEFWKSPLNYKGYKMSSGKIVLYGMNPDIPVNLTLEEGAYYLQVSHGIYHVDFTDDYKPFEKVIDKTILKAFGI